MAARFRRKVTDDTRFGSHLAEERRLRALAENLEWDGQFAEADRLRELARYHREQSAICDMLPLF